MGLIYEERQERIQRWGFKCTCEACSALPEERAASDRNRKRVEFLGEEVVRRLRNGRPQAAIDSANEAIDLLEKEGLYQQLSDYYESIARIYRAINDKKRARVYASKALGVLTDYVLLEGSDNNQDLETLLNSL
jgi:tetratricopeptide (TPR) repeat protein